MLTLRSTIFAFMTLLVSANTLALEFPDAPANHKDAEAQGLLRVNTDELRKFMPGVIKSQSFKEKTHKLTFNDDGSVDRAGLRAKESTGKWHLDEKINGYCLAFQERKGYKETCFATFRAADGIHFFDYDAQSGFFTHVWRPVKAKRD